MLRNNLAKLMIDRNITATRIYSETGIARSTISKISNNNTDKISMETIDKLCNYLEVTPRDFFDFWPYDLKVEAGFTNFDNLDEIKDDLSLPFDFVAKGFMVIEFHHGKNYKKVFDYSFDYIIERGIDNPYNLAFLDNFELETQNNELSFFDDIPIQFQNDIISKVVSVLCDTFNVWETSKNIKDFDIDILKGTK
ncbi:helix-turn-helix domain-containing protein [Streptococcus pluranimalium]|uniref:helix-turn-helix domain-containing protein n=1 Tax=Streptococcus pluranimalium TaxID=82348 RepID=UPI003F67374B